ncbi:MAG: Coenzyme F420 hydrogenase/dehydrogenase, beta subunit C-terminal domain [Alphaproteobacteria bacterium]|nr:Coenzyme F420 hydrogenase/dehydrogenase, beta subunit C-terminal domain [Alphaproteobacteria bacterium]
MDEETQRFNAIIEQDLCIGCGLCASVAGDKLKFCKTGAQGYERPIAQQPLSKELVDKIYDICPGTRMDGLPRELIATDSKEDNVWGVWRRMIRAYAGDKHVRHEGSTGGVLTALAIYLLESKRVDFILHAKPATKHPDFGEQHISYNRDDVMAGVGSRYAPCAPLLDIKAVLTQAETNGQNSAFIGKPCDINALRSYARHDERVDKHVKYWLTLVCGGFSPPSKNDEFMRAHDLQPEQLEALRYRGLGCPGDTTITAGGVTKNFHYLDYWGDDEEHWQLGFRCKICPDGIGDAADIAAADSWLGGSPQRNCADDAGTNAVIIRTEAGQELYEAAVRDGALREEGDIPPDIFSTYQPHQVNKKYAVWARHQALGEAGRIKPVTNHLRLRELSDEMPDNFNEMQKAGTLKRILG